VTATVYTQNPTPANVDNPVAERDPAPPSVQVSGDTATAGTATLSPLFRTGDPPIESGAPVGPAADSQTNMSRSLDSAEEAMDTVKTWKSTVGTIKLVMDIVAPIMKVLPNALFSTLRCANFHPSAELPGQLSMDAALKDPRGVCPCLVRGHGTFILPRRQTLLQQFKRDDNVRTLLRAVRDAFEFAKEADILRNIKPGSKQAEILDEMLQCVSGSAEFIELYGRDVQVGTLP
jgi:hypothetical protein